LTTRFITTMGQTRGSRVFSCKQLCTRSCSNQHTHSSPVACGRERVTRVCDTSACVAVDCAAQGCSSASATQTAPSGTASATRAVASAPTTVCSRRCRVTRSRPHGRGICMQLCAGNACGRAWTLRKCLVPSLTLACPRVVAAADSCRLQGLGGEVRLLQQGCRSLDFSGKRKTPQTILLSLSHAPGGWSTGCALG
jgi:hypothetical protein